MGASEMTADDTHTANESHSHGSEDGSQTDYDDARAALAAAFDTDQDPLAQYTATFELLDTDEGRAVGVDPFDMFLTAVIEKRDPAQRTRQGYRRAIHQWKTYMRTVGRHPACPTAAHVRGFVRHRRQEYGNAPRTVLTKLHRLQRIFRYWQDDPAFPHTASFDPFALALATLEFEEPSHREYPWLSLEALREHISAITHVRTRALVVIQLKLGLRAGEVCNLQLTDIHLTDSECQRWYPTLGSHPRVANRPNAVYVGTRYDRPGNKSTRPRVLPVDTELQHVLRAWLLVRPNNEQDEVFLTQHTQAKLDPATVNRAWTETFHPAYAGTETERAVTSHYGRHRFTTYWRVTQALPRELVQYMRGDVLGNRTTTEADEPNQGREAIDDYLHAYYEDIEPVYREQMYQLGVSGLHE